MAIRLQDLGVGGDVGEGIGLGVHIQAPGSTPQKVEANARSGMAWGSLREAVVGGVDGGRRVMCVQLGQEIQRLFLPRCLPWLMVAARLTVACMGGRWGYGGSCTKQVRWLAQGTAGRRRRHGVEKRKGERREKDSVVRRQRGKRRKENILVPISSFHGD